MPTQPNPASNSVIVLFGITGDLSRSKLIPSLARLWQKDQSLSFIGFGRKEFSKTSQTSKYLSDERKAGDENKAESGGETFFDFIKKYSGNADFAKRWTYVQSDLDEDKGYRDLKNIIQGTGKKTGTVFYIALPPQFQKVVASKIVKKFTKKSAKLPKNFALAFEKPFGHSSASAKALNKALLKNMREEQILRVDHYAGKQALIDIEKGAKLGAFGESFNNKHISKITVNFLEKNSANGRGAFYDHVGALADVLQNHMLYMLSTILAVPYILKSGENGKSISKIREKVLSTVEFDFKNAKNTKAAAELGQYKDFKKESGVSPKSKTETSFKIKGVMGASDKYWSGVEVELAGGKSMPENDSAIYLHYNRSAAEDVGQKEETLRLPVNGYGTKEAYDEIFESAVKEVQGQKTGRFISLEQALQGWKLVEKIKKLKLPLKIYE